MNEPTQDQRERAQRLIDCGLDLDEVAEWLANHEKDKAQLAKQQTEMAALRAVISSASDHPLVLAEGGTNNVDRCLRVINRLTETNWYWDDNDLESAADSLSDALKYYDSDEIVALRPLHELPTVYALVGKEGEEHRTFGSLQAAEKARGK